MKNDFTAKWSVLKDFFNKNPGAFLHLDRNGMILYANPASLLLFENRDLIGQSWLSVCPGITEEEWKAFQTGNVSFSAEAEIAGTCILFSYVRTDPSGDVFVSGTDITQQKIIERKLEEQHATIAEMARFPDMNPGPVIRMDPAGKILLSNDAAVSVFGKNILEKNWREICSSLNDETWYRVLSTGQIIPVEMMIGEKCYVFHHRTDENKKLVFVYGTDITINKLIEKKLEEQKAAMTAMARFPDMNPGPVIRMDLQGKIILSNTASRNIFGEDITGSSWLQVCPKFSAELWDKVLESENLVYYETTVRDREFVFTHRHDIKSQLVFVYGTDITQQKLTEKQLRHAEKMASLGEMTAGIAHEIQNPLNFVNNFSDLSRELIEELKKEKSKPGTGRDEKFEEELLSDIYQNLKKISHHGKRADAIVKSMLQHTRAGSSLKEPVDINSLCDEYLRLAYHAMQAKDSLFRVSIKKKFDLSLKKIHIVQQEIGRVILNLLNNAFYAVSEKQKTAGKDYHPEIIISTGMTLQTRDQDKQPAIEIKVCDNGTGIPAGIAEKIFQPFFTTKPTGQGTGLGLSLSYDIIRSHGGDLKVDSTEGKGSDFTIILPAVN